MDFIIEKCTELGVRSFIPITTELSLIEFKDQSKIKSKLTRWNKVAVAAMKQSLRCFLPKIEAPIGLSELTQKSVEFEKSLMANLEGGAKPVKEALKAEEPVREILLLVGPESGFTQDETDLSCSRGFVPVRLGPRRLRTETACVVFCSLVMGYSGELE
jgi:16S rRNA (uracil1498-N3)-methyltransferase